MQEMARESLTSVEDTEIFIWFAELTERSFHIAIKIPQTLGNRFTVLQKEYSGLRVYIGRHWVTTSPSYR